MGSLVEIGSFIVRLALAAVLGHAGLTKASEPAERRSRLVRNYGILPARVAGLVGLVLPFYEILLALALVTGFFMPITAIMTASLFFAFAVGMIFNLVRGRSIDCGCFGSKIQHTISWQRAGGNVAAGVVAFACGAIGVWERPIAITGPNGGLHPQELWTSAFIISFICVIGLLAFSALRLRRLTDLGVEGRIPQSRFGRVLVVFSDWLIPREGG